MRLNSRLTSCADLGTYSSAYERHTEAKNRSTPCFINAIEQSGVEARVIESARRRFMRSRILRANIKNEIRIANYVETKICKPVLETIMGNPNLCVLCVNLQQGELFNCGCGRVPYTNIYACSLSVGQENNTNGEGGAGIGIGNRYRA